MSKSPTTDLRCRSPVHYQLCNGLLWLMTVWIDTGVYCALVSKTTALKLLKINFVMPEDRAITLSKSDVDPCSHGRDPDRQKCRRTDRQTDGFSALYSRLLKYTADQRVDQRITESHLPRQYKIYCPAKAFDPPTQSGMFNAFSIHCKVNHYYYISYNYICSLSTYSLCKTAC